MAEYLCWVIDFLDFWDTVNEFRYEVQHLVVQVFVTDYEITVVVLYFTNEATGTDE